MVFNSLVFCAFLPLSFAGYWLICYPRGETSVSPRRLWMQNLFIVVASYIFYGWWDWRFLLLITLTAVWSWASGLRLTRLTNGGQRKLVVVITLVVNLGILVVFKYYNFFVENAAALLVLFGFKVNMWSLKIILPVGISFYTFQALSYVVDVYRKDIEPTKDVVAFLAFVSFFPQLVAGPIERATNLLPQFLKPRRFDYALAVDGSRHMLWGFFKKMVIADGCAPLVDKIFSGYLEYPGSVRLIGAVLFAFQIYGDFSGYSDIAIGCARLFGFQLMRNFSYPYFSRDIAEFWRRWHISLMTWFRDYLYIPLGGSRCAKWKTIRNVFVVFLVSGLWHGANWTFILWGGVHACLFLPLLVLGSNRKNLSTVIGDGRMLPTCREAVQMLTTFVFVAFTWILFRAPDLSTALGYIKGIGSPSLFAKPTFALSRFPWLAFLVVVEWFSRDRPHPLCFKSNATDGKRMFHCLRICLYLIIVVVCAANKASNSEFIYFQF